MRDAPVDEPLLHVALGLRDGRGLNLPTDLSLSLDSFRGVGKQIVRVLRRHQASTSQRQSNPTGVYGDPAPPPLLCDVRGRPAAAGRIENEIAWVRGHEETTFNYFSVRLDYEDLLIRETSRSRIRPDIPPNPICEIFVEASILDTVLSHMDASGSGQPFHAFWVIGLPVGVRIRLIRLTLVSKWLRVCGRSLTSEITRLV